MSVHNSALRRCKNIDEATAYTALHMGINKPSEVAKLLLLARCNRESYRDFTVRLAEVSPIKEHSISINHSRFERLQKSKNENDFIGNFLTCLRAINYDCSSESIETIVDRFFNRDEYPKDKTELWNFDICYKFYSNQPKGIDDA